MTIINLIAIGPHMPRWIDDGIAEYHKRFPPEYALTLTALPLAKQRHDVKKAKREESERLFSACKPGSFIVELNERGKLLDTVTLAATFTRWCQTHNAISFLIGGPDGIDSAAGEPHSQWSLSPLTFPHPVVRLLVVEQLYRVIMLLKQHPYHRG